MAGPAGWAVYVWMASISGISWVTSLRLAAGRPTTQGQPAGVDQHMVL